LSRVEADLAATKKLQKLVQGEKANVLKALSWLEDHKISSQDDVKKLGEERSRLQKVVEGIPTDVSKASISSLAIDSFSQGIVSDILALQMETAGYDKSRHAELQSDFTEIEQALQGKSREQGSLTKELETAKAELLTLTQAEAKLSRASRYVKLFETIRADLFNRDGALATSLRSWALKQISSKASEYIRNFGVGISMITLQESRREVDIECYGASGTVDVASMSGGEKVAVALALRFAMASLMSKGRVDFIILDEPTAHLDVDRRKSLVKLISDFNSSPESVSLSQIIVITHDSEIFEDSEVNALFRFESSPEGTIVVKS
jgi:exonuclease SbcC